MPRDWISSAMCLPTRSEESDLFGDLLRPVELLSKLFEGPEGGAFGLEHVLERMEWKETTR